eukprot:GCRY01000449.1.p1 GENE.GCRY01000449.1~~GCRY01000449.1.p1  ORF type:complete len:256 (+),score=25.45 GCRY01000449.1:174-941(+)
MHLHVLCLFLLAVTPFVSCVRFEKVLLVDHQTNGINGESFLFRGDEPLNDKIPYEWCGNQTSLESCFGYDELHSFFILRAIESQLSFPSEYFLLDLSFAQANSKELFDFGIERAFFNKNPKAGVLRPWEVNGTFVNPMSLSEADRMKKAKTFPSWSADNLVGRIQQIQKWLHSGYEDAKMPLVIYGHCEHGMDRTGEMFIAYDLIVKKKSFREAVTFANKVGVRKIMPENFFASQWLCLYLKVSGFNPTLDCVFP